MGTWLPRVSWERFMAWWVLIESLKLFNLPVGPQVVPFSGLYIESYKVFPKRNCLGAYG